jgi:hypothetical protein
MLSEYFDKNEPNILDAINNSDYQHTSKALFNYYKKSKYIDDAIQKIDFHANFYPCIILFRSQIEHFIVATYIWIQFRITEKDDVAKTYHEEYMVFEVLKRINYSKNNNINMSSRIAIALKRILEILTDKKI